MQQEKTEYGWLRFYLAVQDIIGGIMMVVGILLFVAFIADAKSGHADSSAFLVIVLLVFGGVAMIALAQGLKAIADIADGCRYLPMIFNRMDRPPGADSSDRVEVVNHGERLLPEKPLGPVGPVCPQCRVPINPAKPICPKCGNRVRISRPA